MEGRKGKYHESELSPAILLCMPAQKGQKISSPACCHFILICIWRFVSNCNPVVSQPAVLPSLVPYCSVLKMWSCSLDLHTWHHLTLLDFWLKPVLPVAETHYFHVPLNCILILLCLGSHYTDSLRAYLQGTLQTDVSALRADWKLCSHVGDVLSHSCKFMSWALHLANYSHSSEHKHRELPSAGEWPHSYRYTYKEVSNNKKSHTEKFAGMKTPDMCYFVEEYKVKNQQL